MIVLEQNMYQKLQSKSYSVAFILQKFRGCDLEARLGLKFKIRYPTEYDANFGVKLIISAEIAMETSTGL